MQVIIIVVLYNNSCLGNHAVQAHGSGKLSHVTRLGLGKYKKKKIDPKILLPSDLVGGIFESLGDTE